MNDISVKIVESLKEQPAAVVSPSAVSGDNEVDPLALEEGDLGATKDPLVEDVTNGDEEKAGNCDENAKEEKLSENGIEVKDNLVALEAEKIKEELLKEDSNSLGSVEEEVADKDIPEPVVLEVNRKELTIKENEQTPVKVLIEQETVLTAEVVKEPVESTPTIKHISPAQTPQLKEPSPVKEAPETVPDNPKCQMKVEPEEEMMDVVEVPEKPKEPEPKIEKPEPKLKSQSLNGDINKVNHKEEKSSKRRASEEVETESPLKRLCQEVEKTFPQHDFMISDYIQTATKNNIDEIQRHTEQLLSEIQTLRELAQKKEQEWNNILHLKKVKEEILLRLLRRKQVLSFEKAADVNGSDRTDPYDYLNQAKNLAIDKSDEISGLAIKQPSSMMAPMMPAPVLPVTSHFNPMSGLPPPYDKAAHMQNMPKPVYPQAMMMPGPMPGFPRDMNGQLHGGFNMPMGRQGPTKDVKSIIADYRQRNPEVTPRRGRRMKSLLNPNMMNIPRPIAPKMDPMNSLNNLNMLFNNLDMNQKAMLERLQQIQAGGLPNGLSFKDVLVQFANMQQSSGLIPPGPRPEVHRAEARRRHEEPPPPPAPKPPERRPSPAPRLPPPPPYPEISLLPVNSSQENSAQNSLLHGILTKNCGEITITPVQPTPPPPPEPQPEKPEEVVQLDDEESPTSEGSGGASPGGSGSGSGSGRLVIDEGADAEPAAEPAEPADDAPLCQGCRRRDAQFVCAGCANQWYCSRDCQVAAWDEHSEMCSG